MCALLCIVSVSVTRTACTHCTACSCLRAYGTERDYIVSYSLSCTLSWWFGGLSCSTVLWAHPGNVIGIKSCEPGEYYVIYFSVWEPSSPSPSWAMPHRSTGAQHCRPIKIPLD